MLATVPLWVLQHLPVMIFVFCLGSCVGSFANVAIYRLPAGMSVVSPPSRCPTCGARLRFFRENLPILGWFFKNRRENSDREEVLVFITPRIINRAESIVARNQISNDGFRNDIHQ